MAGILKVDDLRGNTSAGDITITSEGGSATMQLQQGVAKAWVGIYNQDSGQTTGDSINTSSITDDSNGLFTVNYSNSLSSSNYSAHCGAGYAGTNNRPMIAGYASNNGRTSSATKFATAYHENSLDDTNTSSTVTFGDLA